MENATPQNKKAPIIINHLLVIDDDPLTEVLLDGISGNLHLINRYVFKASGKQALDYLAFCNKISDFPDLIMVDVRMPEMDGYEFLRKYEETFYDKFPETKIVIATNADTFVEREEAKEFKSIKLFINKPIVKERFVEIHRKLYT